MIDSARPGADDRTLRSATRAEADGGQRRDGDAVRVLRNVPRSDTYFRQRTRIFVSRNWHSLPKELT